MAYGSDYRDSAADTRLKQEIEVILLREGQKLRALRGDELLIRGDDALSVFQASLYIVISGVKPAHDLGDYLYFGVV